MATGRYRPLRCLIFNVTVVIISTTTQLQSDVDRVVIFDWIDIYRRRFDGLVIYFLKSDLKFFDASRHPADAYNARRYADALLTYTMPSIRGFAHAAGFAAAGWWLRFSSCVDLFISLFDPDTGDLPLYLTFY